MIGAPRRGPRPSEPAGYTGSAAGAGAGRTRRTPRETRKTRKTRESLESIEPHENQTFDRPLEADAAGSLFASGSSFNWGSSSGEAEDAGVASSSGIMGGSILGAISAWAASSPPVTAAATSAAAADDGSRIGNPTKSPPLLGPDSPGVRAAARISAALNRAAALAGIREELRVPKIVVTGGQSAGKSSLMNALIGVDLLPTAAEMCTRVPLALELRPGTPRALGSIGGEPSETSESFETSETPESFETYEPTEPTEPTEPIEPIEPIEPVEPIEPIEGNRSRRDSGELAEAHFPAMPGAEAVTVSIPLADPRGREEAVSRARAEIERRTALLAGDRMGISGTALSLRITAPGAPPLACVDTPGLTEVGLASRGQPSDMRAAVRAAVSPHLEGDSTLLCVVAAARPDLEADPGVAFAREHDPEGRRTLGVLTKVDLCDDVRHHLEGRSPPELRLALGYRGVCLLPEGCAARRRVEGPGGLLERAGRGGGVAAVAEALGAALAARLARESPRLRAALAVREEELRNELSAAGEGVPEDPGARAGLLHALVGRIGERLCALADGRGVSQTCAGRNFGSELRCALEDLRGALLRSDPFAQGGAWSDEDIMGAIRRARGNQLACGVSPVELIEYAMASDSDKAPLREAEELARAATERCRAVLAETAEAMLAQPETGRFPALCSAARGCVAQLLAELATACRGAALRLVASERSYVWLETPSFDSALSECASSDAPVQSYRKLLQAYNDDVRRSLARDLPRCIMMHLVREFQSRIAGRLFESLTDPDRALREAPEMEGRRRRLSVAVDALAEAIDGLDFQGEL